MEPTVILDVLTQCNYNVKDACEKLVLMGYDKKETVLAPPKLKDRPDGKENKAIPKPSPGPARPKNLSEKHKKKGTYSSFVSGSKSSAPLIKFCFHCVTHNSIIDHNGSNQNQSLLNRTNA